MDTEEARAIARTFDPNRLDAGFYEEPYDTYAALRTYDPVHRCPDGSYFLSRFADLDQIYRDRSHFSSDKKTVFGPKFGPGSPLYEHHTRSLVFNDPPYHTRVRRQIVGALSPNALRALEPGVTALVDRLLGQLQERQRFDLIEDFAAAIPVEVIGNLLRVPREDRGPLRGWSLAILGALETELTPEQRARGNHAVTEFTAGRGGPADPAVAGGGPGRGRAAAELRVPAECRPRDHHESHRQRPVSAADSSRVGRAAEA